MARKSVSELHPGFYLCIGEAVTIWSLIDHTQGRLLALLLRAHPALAFVVTENTSSKTLTDWLRTLLSIPRIEEQLKSVGRKLRDILPTLDELRGERNALIHGMWTPDHDDAAVLYTLKWERNEVYKGELVTEADIEDLVDRLDIAAATLCSLYFQARRRFKRRRKRRPKR